MLLNLGNHDDTIRANVNSKRQISPAGLANVLLCSKAEAKAVLQRASRRGIVMLLATGWFELPGPNGVSPS